MGYIAKCRFADLEDGKWLYLAGDAYPRDGLTVTDKRLRELAGSDNRMGFPLIEKVDEPGEAPPEPVEKPVVKRGRKRAVTSL